MQPRLKLYHKLFPLLFIPLCIAITVLYGWSFFATITERPGLYGSMYQYYNLTLLQYALYNLYATIFAIVFIVAQVCYLISANAGKLTKTFYAWLLFVSILVVAEIYLQSRFVGKG
jgi:hypothetical protein